MRRLSLVASLLTLAIPVVFLAAAAPPGGAAPGGGAAVPGGAAPGGAAPGGRGGGRGATRGPVSATQPAPARGGVATRHTDFLQIARRGGENIQVLFVGDSITDFWLTAGRDIWDKSIEPLKPANFGISGDTTQGVLWRMQNGELQGFKAKVIVHMLGTNNIATFPNEQIAEGNRLIIEEYKKQQPQAKVLVLGIFPRGAAATDQNRERIKGINTILQTFADNKQVFYLDIGDKFLAADGTLPADVMPDQLHPNAKGYQIWHDAMMPKLQELLK